MPMVCRLYRQEAIYARDKVELDRKLMAQWMGKLGFEVEILADYLFDEIKKAERIFADENIHDVGTGTILPNGGREKEASWDEAACPTTEGELIRPSENEECVCL